MRKVIPLVLLGIIFVALKVVDASLLERSIIAIAIVLVSLILFAVSGRCNDGIGLVLITVPPILLVGLFLLSQTGALTISYVAIWTLFGFASVLSFGYHAARRRA